MVKSKSTYAFNDITLLIVIIVVLLISIFMISYYISGNSLMENFTGNTTGNKSIEYYYMEGCSHCEKFNDSGIWEELKETFGTTLKFNKYEHNGSASPSALIQGLPNNSNISIPSII